jgi:hypothetical protein
MNGDPAKGWNTVELKLPEHDHHNAP